MKIWHYAPVILVATCSINTTSSFAETPAQFPSQIPSQIRFPVRPIRQCATQVINRGATSSHPGLAVSKALQAWDRKSQGDGFAAFESSKNPRINVVRYPAEQYLWKANIIAIPCK